jgi:hypothetical protein
VAQEAQTPVAGHIHSAFFVCEESKLKLEGRRVLRPGRSQREPILRRRTNAGGCTLNLITALNRLFAITTSNRSDFKNWHNIQLA